MSEPTDLLTLRQGRLLVALFLTAALFLLARGAYAQAPLSDASLSSALPSPQAAGTAITWTAGATGGTPPYQFQWWTSPDNGANWTMAQDWGPATYTWTPSVSGNHKVRFYVRDTTPANPQRRTVSFIVNAAGSFAIAGLASDVASPRPAGTPINWTASASGGTPSNQFKWFLSGDDGATWTMVRDWGNETYTWTPTTPGSEYQIRIWGRDATMTTDVSTYNLSVPFTVGPPLPFAISGLSSSAPTPQPLGSLVTWTATAAGGVAPYQFKWWLSADSGATWTLVQPYSSGTYSWVPYAANANYQVKVLARDATITVAPSTLTSPFVVTSNGFGISGLSSSPPSPQQVGTPTAWMASATGGTPPYQFKWWLSADSGATWTMVRDWGGATWNWTPNSINSGYRVKVWARDSTMNWDVPVFSVSVPFVTTATPCNYSASPTGLLFTAEGAEASVDVTVSPYCDWTASNTVS